MRITRTALAIALLLWAVTWPVVNSAAATGKLPGGWFAAGDNPADYDMGIDPTVAHGGKASGYIKPRASSPRGFGTLMQTFKGDDYRGKRVRMSGYVKAEKLAGWAGLWMRVDGPENKMLGFDNMQNRPIKGTVDWRKCDIVLDVPATSLDIAFGLLLAGKGQAWVDDIQFEVVSKDVATPNLEETTKEMPRQPQNLTFED
jgi:hypothetical protein